MAVQTLVSAWFSTDEEARRTYLEASDTIFRKHGMTSAVVYRSDASLVGDFTPHAVVMIEWEDANQCRAAFASSEYADLSAVRNKAFERLDITLLTE